MSISISVRTKQRAKQSDEVKPVTQIQGLFKRVNFATIYSLLTHTIEWIDFPIICAKLHCMILW